MGNASSGWQELFGYSGVCPAKPRADPEAAGSGEPAWPAASPEPALRPGYEVDVEAVLAACAAHRVAVEINANPYRLELDWRWHERALALGCLLSINPDAHSTAELDLMKWGVAVARKGGVPKDKVLNAMNLDQVLAHLRKRHQRIVRRGAGILARPVAVHTAETNGWD